MRIFDRALQPAPHIAFTFNGATLSACQGESLAAALAAAGIVILGQRRDGTSRGLWCGMGVCQECVVNIDGTPSLRACMTTVVDGMSVTAQGYAATVPAAAADNAPSSPQIHRPQVLVVGAGPAGLSAARAAALCGASVTIVDERAAPGGQYFKQIARSQTIIDPDRTDAQVRQGSELIAEVEALGVQILSDAAVWGAFDVQEIAVAIHGEQHRFAPERLVLATGVYERGAPLPGWTLPGYMTTGAAQTLMRAYRVLPGRSVVVAGNGPLNLQLAAELVAAGVDVVALVEAAASPGFRHAAELLRATRRAPGLVSDGIRYRMRLQQAEVPIFYGRAVIAAWGGARVEGCAIARLDATGRTVPRTSIDFPVDTVCVGHGFLPSNEIARALGCRHVVRGKDGNLCTVTDGDGLTSIAGVYAIGDAVALSGAHAARCEGVVTGCAVARSLGLSVPPNVVRELALARRQLGRHLAFQRSLWRLFAAPVLRNHFATADTVVCRCEGVTFATIGSAVKDGAITLGAVKRRTRAGMGRCQGRYCESLIAAMIPEDPGAPRDELSHLAPRVPIKPIRIKDLT